jgi:hypothetical protein
VIPGLTLKLVVWILAGVLIVGGLWWVYESGRVSVKTEQAVAAVSAEKKRVSNDAVLRNLPDFDLCVRNLRFNGVRDFSPCDELRGVPAQ